MRTPLIGSTGPHPGECALVRRRQVCGALLAGAAAAFAGPLAAEPAYPSRVVRLISPYAPGGGTDILGRVIAQKLSEVWGTATVIVENRPGAGGNVGAQAVARAAIMRNDVARWKDVTDRIGLKID